jgi:hypothetical protein
MQMKQLAIFLAILTIMSLSGGRSFAQQSFTLPADIKLDTREDYAKYEKTMVEAAKWLEQTDLDKETDMRARINAFCIKWITGSPNVTVDIGAQLAKIYGKNETLLVIYMASYAGNAIETKNYSNKFPPTKAGLIAIMNVYKKGIEIKKSKEMDKIIGFPDSALDGYIAEKFK